MGTEPAPGDALTDLCGWIRAGRLAHTTLVDGSGVVLDTHSHQVFALNRTGDLLYRAMAEGVAVEAELVERVVAAFAVEPATAAVDVAGYLAQLQSMVSQPGPR